MEKKVIITRRFRNNTLRVYQYLLKEFSPKTAYRFLEQLEKRIEFIIKNPETGKKSTKRKNIRSILFTPHNQIFYRYQKNQIEILCLFDMRRNPKKRPY
jgi:plasmid stabilization system protein ParE